MPKGNNQKVKLIYLIKYLMEQTDSEHKVTMGEILSYLESKEIKAERKSIYSDILKRLAGRGIRFVVDATKELLLNVLSYEPFLIKPNNHELGELFGVSLITKEEVVPYAKKLQEMGAKNVLVSMAGEGAVLVDETGMVHKLDAPKGVLVNAVGAGDSMVAGFLAGWEEKQDYAHAFKMGVAAGSASAFSEFLATKEEILLYCE